MGRAELSEPSHECSTQQTVCKKYLLDTPVPISMFLVCASDASLQHRLYTLN